MLTAREIDIIDGMIEVQLAHADTCQDMIERNGSEMAKRQIQYDMERVELLRKITKLLGNSNGS